MDKNTQSINKSMLLLREEFILNISNLINSSGLPLFVVELIMRDLLNNINVELKKQYEYEKMSYENALKNDVLKSEDINSEGE